MLLYWSFVYWKDVGSARAKPVGMASWLAWLLSPEFYGKKRTSSAEFRRSGPNLVQGEKNLVQVQVQTKTSTISICISCMTNSNALRSVPIACYVPICHGSGQAVESKMRTRGSGKGRLKTAQGRPVTGTYKGR